MKRLFSMILTGIFLPLLLIPFVFMGIGIYMTINQHTKIHTYEPVEAEVISKDIEERTSTRKRRTRYKYLPIVEYTYTLGGETYTAAQVTPLNSTVGSRNEAYRIINQFTEGESVTAYYNPQDPHQAFLLKRYSMGPYLFILFPLLILLVFFWFSIFQFNQKERGKSEPAEDGWFALNPGVGIEKIRNIFQGQSFIWWGIMIVTLGHYFYVQSLEVEMKDWIISGVFVVIGVIILGFWIYYSNLCRNLKDAHLLVDRDPLCLGDTFRARIKQQFLSNLQIDKMSLQIRCTEIIKRRKNSSKKVIFEYDYPMLENEMARPGETLFAEQEVSLPEDQPPSMFPLQKWGKRYVWEMVVHTTIPGAPDYRGRFPIQVHEKEMQTESDETKSTN